MHFKIAIFFLSLIIGQCMAQSMSGTGYIVLLKSKETAMDPYIAIEREMKLRNKKETRTHRNKIIRKFQVGNVKGFHGVFGNEVLEYLKRAGNVKNIEKNFYLRFEFPLVGLQKVATSSSSACLKYKQKISKSSTHSIVPTVYVVDSGIHIDHPEFEGRATIGTTTCTPCQDLDIDGHGTHVAGIIASKAFGVYPKVKLISVKVKEGGVGDVASIIQGLEWIAHHVTSTQVSKPIINISLSTKLSTFLNQAVQDLIRNNITVIVSGGNDVQQACHRSPASAKGVITVGAIDSFHQRAIFSNHGPCLDMYAPGQDILSTWHTQYSEVRSGTSMSAPYATAAAAFLLNQFPNSTPLQLKKLILQYGTAGQVTEDPTTESIPYINMETLRDNLEKKRKHGKKKEGSKNLRSKSKLIHPQDVVDCIRLNSTEASLFRLNSPEISIETDASSKEEAKNDQQIKIENSYREKIFKAFLFKSS